MTKKKAAAKKTSPAKKTTPVKPVRESKTTAKRTSKRTTKPPLPDTTGLTLEQVLKAAMETPLPGSGSVKKKSKMDTKRTEPKS